MTLAEYLKASVSRSWEPGAFDCCFFPGEWAVSWGRGDPMATWRGRYRTDRGGLRFIKRAGGLVQLWERGLLSIGVNRVDEPQAGDVGVVLAINDAMRPEPVGGIWTGTKWAFAAARGLAFSPATPLAIWGPR